MSSENKQILKGKIKDFAEKHLEKAKNSRGNSLWCCPFCDSGTGKEGTSAMSISENPPTFHCFKCNESGDIFHLAAKQFGLDTKRDFRKILENLSREYGLPIEENLTENKQIKVNPQTPKRLSFIKEGVDNLNKNRDGTEYLYKRGFNDETIAKFQLGYSPAEKAIIIPYSVASGYYSKRFIDDGQSWTRYSKEKVNGEEKAPLFNEEALSKSYESDVLFVVEGELDAISIEQLGFCSISICGGGIPRLIDLLKNMKHLPRFVIAMDNDDEGGDKHVKKFLNDISELEHEPKIIFTISNIFKGLGVKDANEALTKRATEFKNALDKEVHLVNSKQNYSYSLSVYVNDALKNRLDEFRGYSVAETGFNNLDSILGGGLYPGLYVLGAEPALGKTAICNQIACEIAHNKKHVLFFNLEMSTLEVATRGISRTIVTNKNYGTLTDYKYSSLNIRKGVWNNEPLDKEILETGASDFANYIGDYFHNIELDFRVNIETIKEGIEKFIKDVGSTPVVFIDYLQIISCASDSYSQNKRGEIDKIVEDLKLLSKEKKTPIFLISSLSRGNYLSPIAIDSFKESGGIEYTADVVIGLQFSLISKGGMFLEDGDKGSKREAIQKEMSKCPRFVDLKILKNRFGKAGVGTHFAYYPHCDFFKELTQIEYETMYSLSL